MLCYTTLLYSFVVKRKNVKVRWVGRCMIRMMCGVRVVDKVSTDFPRDRVLLRSRRYNNSNRPQWYGQGIRRDIDSQTREAMEIERTEKRKKGRKRKL